jgi:hypothetical protein
MKPKTFIIEFIVLLAIYITIRLLASPLIDLWGNKASFDINFNDTYYVISFAVLVIPVFLMIVTLIYLIREGFYRYKRKLQNLVLVIANFSFLTVLYPLSILMDTMSKPLQRFYQPSSSLMKTESLINDRSANTLFFIKQITPGTIIIFMLILVITSILTGKNWSFSKNEQQIL